MWTDESLNDAMHLLLDAATVEKVTTDDSTYVVANEVPYTEELYALALDELIRDGRLKPISCSEERQTFKRSDRIFDAPD